MAFLGGLCFAGLCLAEDTVTIDFPIQSAFQDLPGRLAEAPHQVATPDGKGYLEIALKPAEGDRDVLVTVIFREDGEKGPSLSWCDEAGQQKTLSENLAEGVIGINQRTVRLPSDMAVAPGRLIVFGEQAKILRVRLDWPAQRMVLAAADQRPVFFLTGDRFLQNTELMGSAVLSPPDAWFGAVFEAFLQEDKESLSQPVEFAINLEQAASQALLNVKVFGLGLDQAIQVWVNDLEAGKLQPMAPALTDAGYITDKDGNTIYAGWRNATLFLGKGLLHAGENSISLVSPGGQVFIREAALQLKAAEEAPAPEPVVMGGAAAAAATKTPGPLPFP